jgi:hypothetical protein
MHRNQRASTTVAAPIHESAPGSRAKSLTWVWNFLGAYGSRLTLKKNWLRPVRTMTSKFISLCAALAATSMLAALVHAEDAPATEGSAAGDGITLELNKLEKSDKGCRAYVVVTNPTQTSYDAFRLDLVLFQTDGIIGRRFALDLAPVRPDKSTVKLFDLDGTSCESIGKFLVNDVMECKASGAPVQDCLARLKVKTLTKVEISK